MAEIKKGDRVRINHGRHKGERGVVHHTATGTFHGVYMGGALVGYYPALNLDPDNDHDVDVPGQPDNDAPPSP